MDRAEFDRKLEQGYAGYRMSTAVFIFANGARHIAPVLDIKMGGVTVSYCEVNCVDGSPPLRVRYDDIMDVVDFATFQP